MLIWCMVVSRVYSLLAQLVEQLTVNQCVAGSSPAQGAKVFGDWRSLVAHLLWEQRVVGSNPTSPTKFDLDTRDARGNARRHSSQLLRLGITLL